MEKDVHLWIAPFCAPYNICELFQILSQDEKNRANSFVFKDLRSEFIICRGTLRKVLSTFLQISPHEISFQYTEYEKPEICFRNNVPFYFNISHSADYFAIALSEFFDLGIDIEYCKKDLELLEIAKEVFTEKEILELLTSSRDELTREFYRIWTIKEAYMKAVGKGFSLNPKSFEIDDFSHSFRLVNSDKKDLGLWYFLQHFYTTEYSLALVTPFSDPQLIFH